MLAQIGKSVLRTLVIVGGVALVTAAFQAGRKYLSFPGRPGEAISYYRFAPLAACLFLFFLLMHRVRGNAKAESTVWILFLVGVAASFGLL